MDLKSDDLLSGELNIDIDPTILLSCEFEKMKFASEQDVESFLSVDTNKVIETNHVSQDSGNQDLQTCTNAESVTDEVTPEDELEKNKDINGNEKCSPDKILNEQFFNLKISDSEEELSKIRERGRDERRSTNSQNRLNYVDRSKKYNRSQINPNTALHTAGGSYFVQNIGTSNHFSFEQNLSYILNKSQTVPNLASSNPVFTPRPVIGEDLGANSVGSPESGYGSSVTGSPPPASVSPHLDQIPETTNGESSDFQEFIEFIDREFLFENASDCALPDRSVPSHYVDDSDHREKKIIEIVEYLKNTSNELPDSPDEGFVIPDSPNDINDDASSSSSIDYPSVTKSSEKKRTYPVPSPPQSKNIETPIKLEYKLENKAKNELRGFLSVEEFYAVKARIYRQINEDKAKRREIKVIRVTDEMDKLSDNRTNLHEAVLNQNIEEIYCLVEIQKQYKKPFSDINIRDKYGKTALDYAIQNNMTHVVDYLKENTACQSVNV